MAALVAEHGPVDPYVWDGIPQLDPTHSDRLGGLALHITAQQISVVAALAIWGRFLTLLGGRVRAPALAAATDEELRGVGMSGAKSRALRRAASSRRVPGRRRRSADRAGAPGGAGDAADPARDRGIGVALGAVPVVRGRASVAVVGGVSVG